MTDQWKAFRNEAGEEIIVTGNLDGVTAPGAEVTKAEVRSKLGTNERADVHAVLGAIAMKRQTELGDETERLMNAYTDEVARINRGGGSIGTK